MNEDLLDLLDACVPLGDPRANSDPYGRALLALVDVALADLNVRRVWRLLDDIAEPDDTRRMAASAAETN